MKATLIKNAAYALTLTSAIACSQNPESQVSANASEELREAELELTEGQIKQVQRSLCVEDTGIFDSKTRTAVSQYELARESRFNFSPAKVDGHLQMKEFSQLIMQGDCPKDLFNNAFERYYFGTLGSNFARTDRGFVQAIERSDWILKNNEPGDTDIADDVEERISKIETVEEIRPTLECLQAEHGLEVNGEWNPATMAKLDELFAKHITAE